MKSEERVKYLKFAMILYGIKSNLTLAFSPIFFSLFQNVTSGIHFTKSCLHANLEISLKEPILIIFGFPSKCTTVSFYFLRDF
jgi:hypothetical protein